MHVSPLVMVAYFAPFALGGIFFSLLRGLFLHVLPGTVLLVIWGIGWLMAPLLFAIMPRGAGYWPYVFPAMICGTLGMDVTYNVTNIFVTTSLLQRQQRLAAAVANSVIFLGITEWLAGLGLITTVLFVKIKPAKSEVTVDEKEGNSGETEVPKEEMDVEVNEQAAIVLQ
ncbi:drug resistance protein YOR378W [Aspergillus awamori]|uniref:Drug resistance protein YOR378W n=1 Tax=Aspergillus awamori TaxID=105351 RepID=A0A401KYR1_ASPAW|nr:drug resistance protein YOR378W [Aspergillus awamori]